MLNSEHPGTLKKGDRIYLSVGPQREMLKHRISAHFWQTFWVKRWELDFLYPEIPSWSWAHLIVWMNTDLRGNMIKIWGDKSVPPAWVILVHKTKVGQRMAADHWSPCEQKKRWGLGFKWGTGELANPCPLFYACPALTRTHLYNTALCWR